MSEIAQPKEKIPEPGNEDEGERYDKERDN
jgi:hypothetical protein